MLNGGKDEKAEGAAGHRAFLGAMLLVQSREVKSAFPVLRNQSLTVCSLVFVQDRARQRECVLCVLREGRVRTPRLLQHTSQTLR